MNRQAKPSSSWSRLSANTHTARRVTDRTTRRGDPYLTPFRHAIRAGHAPFVMMATAYYTRMDKKNPAAFSPFIINTVLRHDLGFSGAVISDDLANARQVSAWSYGARAVKFVNAGGSVVLTVNPKTLPAMYRAVLTREGRPGLPGQGGQRSPARPAGQGAAPPPRRLTASRPRSLTFTPASA